MFEFFVNMIVWTIVGSALFTVGFIVISFGLAIVVAIVSAILPLVVIGGGMFVIFGVLGIGR